MEDEKKVVSMNELEEACEDVVEEEETIEKEPMLAKAKRLVKNNKKKLLAAGALLVTGVIGFALGARSDDEDYDDDIVDSTCEEVDADDSEGSETTEE